MDNHSLRTPSRPSKRSSMSEEWARSEQHHTVQPLHKPCNGVFIATESVKYLSY